MKTKNLLLAIAMLMSSTAFAGPNDLKIFNTLLKVGAKTDGAMSHIYVDVQDIQCAYSMAEKKVIDCSLTDNNGDEGKGAVLQLTGAKANAIFALLGDAGAPSDNGMGKMYLEAAAIDCSQVTQGVAPGSAADRTDCKVTLIAEQGQGQN